MEQSDEKEESSDDQEQQMQQEMSAADVFDMYRAQCPLRPHVGLLNCHSVTCNNNYSSFSNSSNSNQLSGPPGGEFFKHVSISRDGFYLAAVRESNLIDILQFDYTELQRYSYYATNTNSEVESSSTKPIDDYAASCSNNCGDSIPKGPLCVPVRTISPGDSIYDLKWFPRTDAVVADDNNSSSSGSYSGSNSSSRFITSCRDHPIQLWDASCGAMLATYSGYDHLDELDSAVSICFSPNGSRIYAGSKRVIRCFDVASPGREVSSQSTCPTRRSIFGQKGAISALDANPDLSGAFAAGSFTGSVGIYAEQCDGCVLHFDSCCSGYGVTCLRWSPCGRFLWVGGRSCDEIVCYDIRRTQQQLGSIHRPLQSNQRLLFDLDPWGRHLCTGSQEGQLLFFDTCSFDLVSIADTGITDCTNSVAFHPFSRLLVSASGERHFDTVDAADDSDNDSEHSSSSCEKSGANFTEGNTAIAAATSVVTGGGEEEEEMPVSELLTETDATQLMSLLSNKRRCLDDSHTPQRPRKNRIDSRKPMKSTIDIWSIPVT